MPTTKCMTLGNISFIWLDAKIEEGNQYIIVNTSTCIYLLKLNMYCITNNLVIDNRLKSKNFLLKFFNSQMDLTKLSMTKEFPQPLIVNITMIMFIKILMIVKNMKLFVQIVRNLRKN